MNLPGGSSEKGMQLIAMSCDHCGAPLSVPDGARSVMCGYCGARLEVQHVGSNGNSMPPKPMVNRNRPPANRTEVSVGWQVVASFKFVHDWHEAARVLGRAGILARMQDDARDASYSALAVPAPDAETARQLLPQGAAQMPVRRVI
jgi:LSD1 subclass zinc finger protein